MSFGKKNRPQKPLVGDTGRGTFEPQEKSAVGLSMVALALVAGFVVGLAVWAVFRASSALIGLVWRDLYGVVASQLAQGGIASWWLPVAFCGLGGLVIGLWTWKFGGAPESLEKVMGSVKQTGGYRLEHPGASVVGFLLPLVFGGSIGPEAGITGIIAAACTRVGTMLKAAGLKVKAVADVTVSAAISAVFAAPFAGIVATAQDGMPVDADPNDYDLRRNAKLVLYTASALGAAGAIALLGSVLGGGGGMPRFDGITPFDQRLLWAIPCLVVGYAGAVLYRAGDVFFEGLSLGLGERPVLKPVLAGLAIGVAAILLPDVLFSGEEQAVELMEDWEARGAVALLATCMAKCLLTPLCLKFGWCGGHFFPCIFSGISAGYGIAALSGVDPMFCVALTTATLVAGVQRKPLVALALLLLCFPASSLPWMGVACLVGAFAPMPARLTSASQEKE